jgi:hypothetical protein
VLDQFHGLPTHALIVHLTVVVLPVAALGGILVALVPWLRRRYGVLVLLTSILAAVLMPVTIKSGENFYAQRSAAFTAADVTEAGLMQRHQDLALALPKWVVLLLIGVFLVVVPPLLIRWDRARAGSRSRVAVPVGAGAPTAGDGTSAPARAPGLAGRLELSDPAGPAWQLPVVLVGIVVTLVGAVLTLVMVARVGEAGADAAWQHVKQPAAQAN